MIYAMNLEMSVTIGDFIVTGGSILTIVICYFAMKTVLETLRDTLNRVMDQCDGHTVLLTEHGEEIAALDAAVFGRRSADRTHVQARARADREAERMRKRRLITEEGT